MSAAILEHRNAVIFGTRNDGRRLTDVAADEVAGFGFKANTIPTVAMEDTLDGAPVGSA